MEDFYFVSALRGSLTNCFPLNRRCAMCDCRDECYVVPKKPSTAMGWWFGQVVREGGKFLNVYIVRSQFSSISGATIIGALKSEVDVFEDIGEAFLVFRERKGIPFDVFV